MGDILRELEYSDEEVADTDDESNYRNEDLNEYDNDSDDKL